MIDPDLHPSFTPQGQSAVFLELNEAIEPETYRRLFSQFHQLGVEKVLLRASLKTVEEFLQQELHLIALLRDFEVSIVFEPNIGQFLNSRLAKVDQFLVPYLFCNRQYFKRHQFLSLPIFHFFGVSPEIQTVLPEEGSQTAKIAAPEDIDAIYLINEAGQTDINQAVLDLTENFDRQSSTVQFEHHGENPAKLVVLRKRHFTTHFNLNAHFNYYDSTALAALQKEFKQQMERLPINFKGIAYPLNSMFNLNQHFNGVAYSPSLENVLQGIKKTIAYYFCKARGKHINNLFLQIVFKRFFNSILKSRLEVISGNVHYLIQADSILADVLEMTSQFIIEIDARQFHPSTPAFWRTVASLKLGSSHAFAQGQTTTQAMLHELNDPAFTLAEQKLHIDLLFHSGVTHFWWRVRKNPFLTDFDIKMITKKLNYHNQLRRFMEKGISVTEILVLNPSFDTDRSVFLKALRLLFKKGINFELIGFELFNSNQACKIENGRIKFNQKTFELILLPGIQTIPYAVLKKLARFFKSGGHIAAIQNIPDKVELRHKQTRFEALRQNLWLVNYDSNSISFLQNGNKGKSFFIPRLQDLPEFLMPYATRQALFVENGPVLFKVKETRSSFFIFLTNPDDSRAVEIVVKSRQPGLPFVWNFKHGLQRPLLYWTIFKGVQEIPLKLAPLESRLLIIQKRMDDNPLHLSFCSAEDCRVFSFKENELVFHLHHPTPGPIDIVIEKGKLRSEMPLFIDEALTPVVLPVDHWLLKNEEKQKVIHLNDLGKIACNDLTQIHIQNTFFLQKFRTDYAYYLELGNIQHYCEVFINGHPVGSRWYPPFSFDVSSFVQSGENTIEVVFRLPELHQALKLEPTAGFGALKPYTIVPFQKFVVRVDDIKNFQP